MTNEELLELGIVKTTAPGRGGESYAYIYKCFSCGRDVKKLVLCLGRPMYCDMCRADARKKVESAKKAAEKQALYLESLESEDAFKKHKFETAASTMQRFGGYEKAIELVGRHYKKFDSIPEVIAAIVLINAGYKIIPQQKVSDFRVDFALPEEKVVIEVDGALFHKDKEKKEMRDLCLKHNLGCDWQIIHVPAEPIKSKPKEFERLIKARLRKIKASRACT